MTPREHPCECDLTDDHGEAAELRRRLEARDSASACEVGHACPEGPHGSCCGQPTPAMEAEPVAGMPARLWLGAPTDDHHQDVWFDPDEGGTEYIRADLAHPQDAESLRGLTFTVDPEAEVAAANARADKAEAERDAAMARVAELEAALAQKDAPHKSAMGVIAAASAENVDLRADLDDRGMSEAQIFSAAYEAGERDGMAALTPQPDAGLEALVAALRALELANDALCGARPQHIYDAMISAGMGDRMIELDQARNAARTALRSLPVGEVMSQAARDVLAERQRQITAEGWTPEHDDAYRRGELADAAASYIAPIFFMGSAIPKYWPFKASWWKPTERRRDLVKGLALGFAEVERIDRAALTEGGEG